MSLMKQLWLAIGCLMILAFGGSFLVSTYSARVYLEQQLQLKNIDNATSLALSMSQLDKDPVTIELLLAAQFDAGHYERITLTSPDGATLVERAYRGRVDTAAPNWFAQWVPIQAEPGEALVQDGWEQYGTLTVVSHTGFAVDSLWQGTVRLLQWFLAMGLLSGVGGTLFLKTVSRPLDTVVQQAEAIGDRRFVLSNEPRTHEFKRLVTAMNRLSERVRAMLEKETRQLDEYRRQMQHDAVTGLPNREYFFSVLDGVLHNDNEAATGTVVMARLLNLQEVNRALGRVETDNLLRRIGETFSAVPAAYSNCMAGRTNGSDFILLVPDRHDATALTRQVTQALHQLVDQYAQVNLGLPMATCTFGDTTERGPLMSQLDGALAQAEQIGNKGVVEVTATAAGPLHLSLDDWRIAIKDALAQQGLALGQYAVRTLDGDLIHFETPARLTIDGQERAAGYFVPWMARLGQLAELDLMVAQKALQELPNQQASLAINLSAESLADTSFVLQLTQALKEDTSHLSRLCLECHESSVLRHPAEFRALVSALKQLGCRIGLEHAGPNFAQLENLQDIGLDYIKIDGSLFNDIASQAAQQNFVRGLCSIGHSLGIEMIAQGIHTEDDFTLLRELGVDGVTGKAVS
ncbi:EAL domain-containing protein [Salinispirillum sp. LH 10-3-1]|uniref:EAL domain-containing protein n=1 Tax=Salinispirillum sp. LH 10-3-1 TaxID=2952525 RepID=A0AB38YIC6_9GAMM